MGDIVCFMDRVEQVLKQKKLTQKELAESLHLRRPTLSEWKKNGAVPSGDICFSIAEYLGISAEWLVTGKESSISNEEKRLLNIYRQLSASQRDTIWTLLNKWEAEQSGNTSGALA